MLSASGAELDAALADLGWADMLSDMPDLAIPLVFRLLGETGSHASVLNDVMLETIGGLPGGTPPMPYAGGGWVVWDRAGQREPDAWWAAAAPGARRRADADVRSPPRAGLVAGRLRQGDADPGPPACAGPGAVRQADRVVPGGPAPAGRDAGGHRRRRGDAGLPGADNPDLTALLAKAAAGKAALTAARHCQQVLGGIGFTAEHDLHHHVKRVLVLDGLLGSSRELTRKAGAGLRARGSAPRLAHL